jgi:hypothetical protein
VTMSQEPVIMSCDTLVMYSEPICVHMKAFRRTMETLTISRESVNMCWGPVNIIREPVYMF